MSEFKPVLCGGTFLTLLIQARKGTSPSNISCFNGLMKSIDYSYVNLDGSAKSTVSQFKNCDLRGKSTYIPFGDNSIIDDFNNRIRDNYDGVMANFSAFIDSVIKTEYHQRWFIAALLELIESDDNISEDTLLYINRGFIPSYKHEIDITRRFSFYNFILGIWYYIFSKPMDESNGRETILKWTNTSGEKGTTHDFISEIGMDLKDELDIDFRYSSDNTSSDGSDNEEVQCIDYTRLSNPDLLDVYLERAYEERSRIVTFLYNNEESFYNFFVCSNIAIHIAGAGLKHNYSKDEMIENISITKFPAHRNRIMILGTAGLGKTMLMHHLFLDAIDHFDEYDKIPIFVAIKDFVPTSSDLFSFIFDEFSRYNRDLKLEDFGYLLSIGKIVLILDGLDELDGDNRVIFDKELGRMMDSYRNVLFIVSMRPGENNLFTGRFRKFDLLPLDLKQAKELVSKLDKKYIPVKTKTQFLEDLENNRFNLTEEETRVFLGIPLFLCITLTTYTNYLDIPKKRHEFYQKAYDALCEGHDKIKELRRTFSTGLSSSDFEYFFSEFCARTYVKSKYSFTREELKKYVEDTIHAYKYSFAFENFLSDITERLCIMFRDADHYYFVHRSFQEFFTAFFFSKQPEETFDIVFNKFIKNKNLHNYGDITIEMMYGINKYITEKYIIIPFLEEAFCDCEDYYSFIRSNYQTIRFVSGESSLGIESINTPASGILTTICDIYKINCTAKLSNTICRNNSFVCATPFYIVEHDNDFTEIVPESDLPPSEKENFKDYPPDGYDCFISLDEIHINSDDSEEQEIIKILFDERFPLKITYRYLQAKYKELVQKYECPLEETDDGFSIFHR